MRLFSDACLLCVTVALCAAVRRCTGPPLAFAAAAFACLAVAAALASCCSRPLSCFSSAAAFSRSACAAARSAFLRSPRAPGVSGWFARYFRCCSCCWWASGFLAAPTLPLAVLPPLPPEVNWPPVADPGGAWFRLNRAAGTSR
jgi:hypothetical protein